MDPITITVAVAALLGATALTWKKINNWIVMNKVAAGSAQIVRQRLQSGRYCVTAGIFNSGQRQVSTRTWNNVKIGPDLDARFGTGNVIRVST
jgi:hypothetical protein